MIAIKDLSSSDLEIILGQMTKREIEKNEVLFEQGSKATSMFFLETGCLKVVLRKSKDGGDDIALGAIKPGGYCGELALLRADALYEDTVVAVQHSVVFELNKESLQKIMLVSMTTGTKLLLGISRSIREAMSMPQTHETGKIVAFISPKDGNGRTTAATHLARYLAAADKQVIYIDGDLQLGDASIHLGLSCQPHIARLIQAEERLLFDTIKKYFQTSNGVQLLASPAQPQEAEFVSRSTMNQIIQECARNCDFLILDVPAHIDEMSILMWDVADLMVLVSKGNISETTRLKRLLATLERLNFPKEKFLGLLNMYQPEQSGYLINYRKLISCKWLTIDSSSKAFHEAQLHGVPIWQVEPNGSAAIDAQTFCEQIFGRAPESKDKGGILSRIKSMFAT